MKRITMIGDIGWSKFYHLGDEAMTEFALDALGERGDVEVTLIAGEPACAGQMYGVDSISRIGFKRDRPPNIIRMRQVLDYAESGGKSGSLRPADPAIDVIKAVEKSDAVLIAGGGNLNSMFAHHIFERATLAKLAGIFGKPYALTSQTLGPLIYEEDRGLVHDLLAEAEFVGTREIFTTELAAELGGSSATVCRQVDDAFSLAAREEDRAAISDLAEQPFILASFAEKASSPMISDEDYRGRLSELTGRLSEATGLQVLLVPHGGAFPPAEATRDQLTDVRIAEASGSDKVAATRMLTARQLIALTERAELVIGSRYHAAIFAGAAAVPFISLAPNLYSSIRMRGAAENVGMSDYVLPLDSVDDIVDTVVGVAENRGSMQRELRSRSDARRAEHRKWWDFVVANTIGLDAAKSESDAPGFFHAEELRNDFVDSIEVVRERLNAVQDYGLVMAVKDRKAALARAEASDAKAALKRAKAELARAAELRIEQEADPAFKVARGAKKVGSRLNSAARTTLRRTPFGRR